MNSPRNHGAPRIRYEDRLTLVILAGGLPGGAISLYWLWSGDAPESLRWTATILVAGCWLGLAWTVRARVARPLRTVAGMLAGLREGDYSARVRSGRLDDALGELFAEANALARTLSEQRLTAVEATALLGTVMAEIDVAVFAFDGDRRLKLVNRAGENLLAQPAARLLGQGAEALGLEEYLEYAQRQVVERSFPRGSGRWSIRVSTIWERGRAHRLLVVQDLTRTLREEQLQAWKRLVRVIGHELNNSLTPIKSIASSLKSSLARTSPDLEWKQDAEQGLAVIAGRAEALARFLEAYSRLAKLPPPRCGSMDVRDWVRRAVGLERRLAVSVQEGPETVLEGDSDQLDQLLINLLRNAVDAALETGGRVEVGWHLNLRRIELWVEDEGPGLADSGNLFVPFFTTKPGGSGIGLVLCRQIAEGHGGDLTLENRKDRSGCRATLRLPL